jgi:hypothetical protein
MLIDVDFIRTIRPMAANIDPNRLRMFITEAEHIDIMNAIGAELYRKLDGFGPVTIDDEGTILCDDKGHPIFVNGEMPVSDEEAMLLKGGYYIDKCGVMQYFEGVCLALAYLAFARLIRGHYLNVTAYGVVVKEGDQSTPADVREIAASAQNAEQIGKAYLGHTIAYWDSVRDGNCRCDGMRSPRRFIAIG